MRSGTKKDAAYHQIKQMFLERRFEPGSMLSENAIASDLGMSRTPVREALQILQSEGFVDVFPKKGIMLRGISMAAAKEILDLRAAVEGYVTVKCVPLAEKNLRDLEKMLEVQRVCCEEGDISGYLHHDATFHGYFIWLYGNSLITEVIHSINERFMSVGFAILKNLADVKTSYDGHRSIFEAVKSGDTSRVWHAVYDHIHFGKSQLSQDNGS
ncbi:MAG: GntR family transcriptional regulator [Synergistaceae bacterium]|jgi:DNA-binding GntR family transcriptional regulator|nr:GntR family transcriptional regulator [Synergistaceae bacterium]